MRMRIVSSTLAAAVAVLATLGPVYGRVITFDTRDVSISGTSNNDMGKLMVRAAFAQNDRAEEEEVSQTTSRPARTTSSASEDEEEEPTSTSTSTASRKEEPTKTAEEEYKATAPAGKKVEGEVLAGENERILEEAPEPRDSDALPIQPKLNPALGVAGALLILAGAPYGFIGIKNKRIQIFGSIMFLSSLSVTVLILYVTNPPLSAAAQGGYLIACVLTGAVLGTVSIIFHEMTETMGCLLGGFCLGMWFLVLKEDGLVSNGTGKSIMIALFSLIPYFLSFWDRVRQEALIGSISLAGATAVVLGIDCFSRAGLKEFWLFIWNLNPKTFPEDTKGYPHTRGIKVEIAAIVILTLFAVLSQIRVWNVVRVHREKKEEARVEELRMQEERDLEVGRDMEERTREEREAWERTFGGTVGKKEKKGKEVVTQVEKAEGDLSDKGDSGFNSRRTSRTPSEMDGQPESSRAQSSDTRRSGDQSRRSSKRFSLPPTQEVVETAVQTEEGPVQEEEVDPAMIPLPPSKADLLAEEKRKAEMIPPVDVPEFEPTKPQNRVSASTFETLDDSDWEEHEASRAAQEEGMELRRVQRQRQERQEKEREVQKRMEAEMEGLVYYGDEDRASSVNADLGDFEVESISTESEAEVVESTESPTSPTAESAFEGRKSEDTAVTTPSDGDEKMLGAPAVEAGKMVPLEEIKENIARMPKAYRTNQWALHLSEADKPELDELEFSSSEAETEKPAPVIVEDLLATYLPSQRPVSKTPISAKRSSSAAIPHTSKTHISRTPSVPVTAHLPNRTSTTPDLGRPQSIITPLPTFPTNTLLAKRESQMKSRPSYIFSNRPTDLVPSVLPPTLPSPHPLSTNPSYLGLSTPTPDSGYATPTAPLSRNVSSNLLPQLAHTTTPVLTGSSANSSTPDDDEDTPLSARRTELLESQKRAQREALMAQWRQSLQADEGIKQQKAQVKRVLSGPIERPMENKVAVALEIKRRKEEMEMERMEAAKGVRGSKMRELREREEVERRMREERMRMPDMMEKHREAMMRLQGQVKAQ